MYNFSMYVYAALIRLAAFFNPKAKKIIQGQKKSFRLLQEKILVNQKYIWIHAASLGEFEQGRPLIEAIRLKHPEYRILLTFFSPSGYEVRKDYPGADIICYLPFDTKKNVRKFLKIAQPNIAIFIKYEYWLNYLTELHIRKVPIYMVSAIFRPNQIFFKEYGKMFREVLTYFKALFVQDDRSVDLLATIQVKENVIKSGDTRFDRVLEIKEQAKPLPLIARFAEKNKDDLILIAGSTWPKDEEFVLDYFNNNEGVKLIIAPHEIHQEHIQSIVKQLKRPYLLYTSANENNIDEADCIIINCFGLLSSIYRYGNIAYIGGGFGVGIHNIVEAAVYGIPVIFGPNYHKFREAKGLILSEGGFSIKDAPEFIAKIDEFKSDKKKLGQAGFQAGKYVSSNTGASELIMKNIDF